MCNLGEGIYERGIKHGIEHGKLDSIKNLMNNMQLSVIEAMKLLSIPETDFEKYENMMKA